jgi:hypothetical protein
MSPRDFNHDMAEICLGLLIGVMGSAAALSLIALVCVVCTEVSK